MKKIRVTFLIIPILCIVVMYGVLQITVYYPWVILPIESTSHTLTLVKHGGPYLEKVTIKHTVNGKTCEYVLEIHVPLTSQVPQEYKLPIIKDGNVEISLEYDDAVLPDGIKQIQVMYENANLLYEKGLLIYSERNVTETITIDNCVYYDQYIHFISGGKQVTYTETAGESEWKVLNNAPKPKEKTKKFLDSYIPVYTGWKESNKWKLKSH